MNTLLTSFELFSNYKSFAIGVGCTRTNLWLLHHFNHLKIANYKICYQKETGERQREATDYPKRWLRKQFTRTSDLLAYLAVQSYVLHYLEIHFENGWCIKEQPHICFKMYTNSTSERNQLLQTFFSIAALPPFSLDKLKTNITYMVSHTKGVYALCDLELPDEFWSSEKRQQWRLENG